MKPINITFTKPSSSVSEVEISEAQKLLFSFGEKINKQDPLDRIKISFEEPKSSHGDTVSFNTTLKVFFLSGDYYVANTKKLEFIEAVRSAIDQISKQIRRESKV